MNHVRSGGGVRCSVFFMGFERSVLKNEPWKITSFLPVYVWRSVWFFLRSWFEISEVWEIRVQVRSKLMKKTDFLAQSDLLWLAFLDLYVSDTAVAAFVKVFTQGRICPQFLEFIIYVSSNWNLSITHPSNPIMRDESARLLFFWRRLSIAQWAKICKKNPQIWEVASLFSSGFGINSTIF